MSNEYNPILICNGNEHDLKNHGELICGGCGYASSVNVCHRIWTGTFPVLCVDVCERIC